MDCGREAGELGAMIDRSMNDTRTLGRIAAAIAVIALVAVMTVFFFPAVQGPYSVVHGPVTVFHGARAAAGLRVSVVRAGLNLFRGLCGWAIVSLPGTADSVTGFFVVPFAGCNSLLRC